MVLHGVPNGNLSTVFSLLPDSRFLCWSHWTNLFWLQRWGLLVACAKEAFIWSCHLYMTFSMSWTSLQWLPLLNIFKFSYAMTHSSSIKTIESFMHKAKEGSMQLMTMGDSLSPPSEITRHNFVGVFAARLK